MIGSQIHQYKVLDKPGVGGMSEVFLAQDVVLERKVALKFLPSHIGSDPGVPGRSRREATGTLRHPTIATPHESGEHEGSLFIFTA